MLEAWGRVWRGATRLSTPWLVILLAGGLGLLAVAGVLLYRTYDYVQHDNEFCVSCHLMADPYERFANSAHRGLGCKACHQPTVYTRSKMGLKQILSQPDSLDAHAEVPNRVCAECHVKGDPEKWKIIARSVGHRVHLESDDPSLKGLRCVECHSTGIHEFAPTSRTCGQSGCHENARLRLGKMQDLTVHCVACHNFSRPMHAASEALESTLRPQREQCLSCHAMREHLPNFPEEEVHGAICGACHNPHDQRAPNEAVRNCAVSGCHTDPDTISPFHRGLAAGMLERCTSCHKPHTWSAESDCESCHGKDIDETPLLEGAGPHARVTDGGMLPSAYRALQGLQQPRKKLKQFTHQRHRGIQCTSCHAAGSAHGELLVRSKADCMGCHHSAANRKSCSSCHPTTELGGRLEVQRTLQLTVWPEPRTRTLSFDHARHSGQVCLACHSSSPAYAVKTDCTGCHERHHDVARGAECTQCHRPEQASHPADRTHLGCSGSGCHAEAAVAALPPARPVCLACHQTRREHYPGQDCAACHAVGWSHDSKVEAKP